VQGVPSSNLALTARSLLRYRLRQPMWCMFLLNVSPFQRQKAEGRFQSPLNPVFGPSAGYWQMFSHGGHRSKRAGAAPDS